MEPLSAIAIASLAFVATKAGEKVVDKSLDGLWEKANQLRQKIWEKLKGKAVAEEALTSAESGEEAALSRVASYLDIAMLEDPEFGAEIQKLAQELEAEVSKSDNSMVMNIFGNGKGWQTQVKGGTAYIGDIKIHQSQPPSS